MKVNCADCCFSRYLSSRNRSVLMCRQHTGHVGRWTECLVDAGCDNYYRFKSRKVPAYRLIPLTKGKFAVIDAEDYDFLRTVMWHTKEGNATCYARGHVKGKHVNMHRVLMGAKDGEVVDHIDHDGLNNRKDNLRVCSVAENNRNRRVGMRRKTSSKYKGVSWDKKSRKYVAYINHNRKKHLLGMYHDEIEAAMAYDRQASELFGQFASLNLPIR